MSQVTRVAIVPLLFVALLAHLFFLQRIAIGGASPNIMLIIIIFSGLFGGVRRGFEAGFAGGFLIDLFSWNTFGIHFTSFALTGVLAGTLSTQFFKDSKAAHGTIAALLTFVALTLEYLVARIGTAGVSVGFTEYFWSSILPVSIYTALVAIPVFAGCMHLFGLVREEEFL